MIADRWPQPRQADGVSEVCSLWIPSRHIGVFIRWRVWRVGAEGRAGFLFAQFTGGAGRRPSYGVIADRWPQPRQADGATG